MGVVLMFTLGFGLAGFAEMANEVYDDEYDVVQRQFSAFGINSSGNTNLSSKSLFFRRFGKQLLFAHFIFTCLIAHILFHIPLLFLFVGGFS